MEKRLYKLILCAVFFIIFLKQIIALGVTPGRYEINFEPNLKMTIPYEVFADSSKELILSLDGDLAKYGKLSTDTLKGGGKFNLMLELPENLETPGKNVLWIRVKEKVDDELVEGSIGTSVSIGVAVIVNVAYPGKYLELDFSSNNANAGEPIEFLLNIKSKGTDTLIIEPKIEIMSGEKIVDTLIFNEREIKSQEEIKLKKSWDTSNFNSGKYKAVALVDYGGVARAEHDFRIGELVIDILNYTKKISIGGIKAFEIDIASGWNNNIDGAYAIVAINNEGDNYIEFKTDTEQLTPWEEKRIVGHFDSSNFTEGIHDANITLIYFGKEQGRSTSKLVEVEFVKELPIEIIVAVILIFIIGVVLLIKKFRKNKNGKNKNLK